jgi:hypothetical protein
MNNQNSNPLSSLFPLYCPITKNNCVKSYFNEIDKVFLGQNFNEEKENRENTIKEVLDNYNLQLSIADEKQGSILCQVCEKIKESLFCIFDLSECNHNVFIELGLAIANKKHIIILYNKNININDKKLSIINDIYRIDNEVYNWIKKDFNCKIPSNISNISRINYTDYGGLKNNLNNEIQNLINNYNVNMHFFESFNMFKEIIDGYDKTKKLKNNPKVIKYEYVGIFSNVFILNNDNNQMKNGMIFNIFYEYDLICMVRVVNVAENFSYAQAIPPISIDKNYINKEIRKDKLNIKKIQI